MKLNLKKAYYVFNYAFYGLDPKPEPELVKSRNRNCNFVKSRNRNGNLSKVGIRTGTVKNSYGSATLLLFVQCQIQKSICSMVSDKYFSPIQNAQRREWSHKNHLYVRIKEVFMARRT